MTVARRPSTTSSVFSWDLGSQLEISEARITAVTVTAPEPIHIEKGPSGIPAHTMASKNIFRIIFHNQGSIYEVYAHEVTQGGMYAFVEVGEITFGERSKLVVDPSDEKLKSEFAGVKRTYIPLHAIVRIDEVEKEGQAKIHPGGETKGGNVSPFPISMKPPAVD